MQWKAEDMEPFKKEDDIYWNEFLGFLNDFFDCKINDFFKN